MATCPIPSGPIPSKLFAELFPDRRSVERAIEQLITLLDTADGDPDLEVLEVDEDDLEDCCQAGDDSCELFWFEGRFHWGRDDERDETILTPVYGVDQSEPLGFSTESRPSRGYEAAPDVPCAPISWNSGSY